MATTKATKKENTEIAPDAVVGSDAALFEEGGNLTSLFTYHLSKPISYEGKEYDALTFDFEALTGGDSLDVENELAAKGHLLFVKTSDSEYVSRMCARACVEEGIDIGIFRVMQAKDYNRLMNTAKRFL